MSETLPGHCGPVGGYHARWVLDGDTLTWSDFGPFAQDSNNFTVKPWQKIG